MFSSSQTEIDTIASELISLYDINEKITRANRETEEYYLKLLRSALFKYMNKMKLCGDTKISVWDYIFDCSNTSCYIKEFFDKSYLYLINRSPGYNYVAQLNNIRKLRLINSMPNYFCAIIINCVYYKSTVTNINLKLNVSYFFFEERETHIHKLKINALSSPSCNSNLKIINITNCNIHKLSINCRSIVHLHNIFVHKLYVNKNSIIYITRSFSDTRKDLVPINYMNIGIINSFKKYFNYGITKSRNRSVINYLLYFDYKN